MSASSDQHLERRTVLQDPQCGAVGIDVTGAAGVEKRPYSVGGRTESPLEPTAQLLVEDVEELALPALAGAIGRRGVRREEGVMPAERLEHGVDADVVRGLGRE